MKKVQARSMWLAVAVAAVACTGCERENAVPGDLPPVAAPAPAPAAPHADAIVGHAGLETLLPEEGWMPVAGASRAVFEANLAKPDPKGGPPVRADVLPAELPADAQLGTMWTGGTSQAAWIVTGGARSGYAFRFDANLDGDLTNDPVYRLAQDPGGTWACDVAAQVPDRELSTLVPLRFGVRIHAGEIAIVLTTRRTGVLDVAGKRVAFEIEGLLGRYGAAKQSIAFDLDGDGTADPDPRGDEAFLIHDRRVTLGGTSYDFTVASDGGTVTLVPTPASAAATARPSLKVGAPAPVFDAVDLTGQRVTLGDLRGKVVLLDFWARWCHPCVEAIPDLVTLEAKQRNAGLAVVSVVIEDEPATLRTFAAEHRMVWSQIAEPGGGPIQEAYRIVSVPETYVIGRDGTLACSRCDDLAAAVAAALRH